MNDESFTRAFAYVYGNEGTYIDDPVDSGGPTNFGITQKTLSEWRGRAVMPDEIKSLHISEAMQILKYRYWNRLSPKLIKSEKILIAVFDASVLFGVSQAVKALQRAVEVDPDGILGPKTAARINFLADDAVMNRFIDELLGRIDQIIADHPKNQKYLNGWARRVNRYARLTSFVA